MVHPNVYSNELAKKDEKKLEFKSEGGEDVEAGVDEDMFWMEEDFSPRPSYTSKWTNRYCSLRLLYLFLALFFITFLLTLILQKRAEKLEFLNYQQQFFEFNRKFQRIHVTPEEYQTRFQIFKKNLEKIENLKMPGVNFSVNQFTDRTEKELKMMMMNEKFVDESNNILKTFSNFSHSKNLDRPDYIDWRDAGKVMHIKNQGQCGSCWAFATVAAVESQYAIKRDILWSLSEQELVDCDGSSYGCGGGFLTSALSFILGNGLETEDDYPYSMARHDYCSIDGGKTRVRVDEGWQLAADEDYIADWVASVGPVSFAMSVPSSFPSYSNGIYNPSGQECTEQSLGYHAMAIIGYGEDNGQKYWIIKNSWGNSWGDQGYMRLARGTNACGMKDSVVAPKIN